MIKWKCAFNIPDSTIQLAEAKIRLSSYKNINNTCKASFEMLTGDKMLVDDKLEDVVFKRYERIFDRSCANEDEVYLEELKNYENAEII